MPFSRTLLAERTLRTNEHMRISVWRRHQGAIVVLSAALLLSLFAFGRQMDLQSVRLELERAFTQHEASLREREDRQLAGYEAQLADLDLLSGAKARRAHDDEWNRRMSHERKFARTASERAILEMEQVAASTSIEPERILHRVAELSSPKGSRVEVIADGDKFVVNLAFRLSAMTHGEAGAFTKHGTVASFRNEVLQTSARVIRDLYDNCGQRRIARVNVSCNHAARTAQVPADASEADKQRLFANAPVTWQVFYRGSIPPTVAVNVSNWRKLPLHRVADMLQGEDSFGTLTILPPRRAQGENVDPTDALKY